jgi:hypothetical protein
LNLTPLTSASWTPTAGTSNAQRDRDPNVDDDPRLEELSRFFGLFGNEVRSVLEADADRADLTLERASIAARWAQRLAAMLGPIPDDRTST